MKAWGKILVFLLCVMLLANVAYAETSATNVENWAIVTANGNCQVRMTVTLRLDEPADAMAFPLPKNAKDVTVNGTSVRTYSSFSGDAVMADLSYLDGMVGETSLNIMYNLNNVLKTVDKKLYMDIPLLSGFEYPVQALAFSITMPGDISGKPTFSSIFMQTNIESIVDCVVGGSLISGVVTQPLEDRETLTLTLQVSEEMFPGKLEIAREGNPEVVPMTICGVLALIYWVIFMRGWPLVRQHRTTMLDGLTAGELGSHLTAAGANLTMMIFTWGQLGYVRITPDKYGRVYVQKRMEMGNERTDFEMRCFRALFSKGNMVEATGNPYARLFLKVEETIPGIQEMYRRRAGNVKLFRAAACGISFFCGICFAMNMGNSSLVRVLLSILLCVAGVVSAWLIQGGMYRIHIRGKLPLLLTMVFGLVWLLLGILAGQFLMGLIVVLLQLLAGLAAAYGGLRSDLGRHEAGMILGLRHYLKHISREELTRVLDNNPDFFFEMLPYAIALGVDIPFARAFDDLPMPYCSYFGARENPKRTAAEWAALMRKTADRMDKRQRQMEFEKWFPVSGRRR